MFPCWLPWHHAWGKWERYQEKGKRPGAGVAADSYVFIDERERRSCGRCGATQDRRIVLKDSTKWRREG